MANDLTFGMDVVIDKILGLGQFDALGKKLQSVVAKAVEAGLLQGVPEARESLRAVYGKSDVASRNSALKRLYAYSAKVEADENKRIAKELAADERRAEREAASLAKAEAKQAERREKFEAAAVAYRMYSPYATTSATASYAESTIARQNLQYLTRITNRDLIDEEGLRSATTQQLIERSRANWEAKNIRYNLPFNRLMREGAEAARQADRNSWRNALKAEDEYQRALYEAANGPVSEEEWAQISLERVFGGEKIKELKEKRDLEGIKLYDAYLAEQEKKRSASEQLLLKQQEDERKRQHQIRQSDIEAAFRAADEEIEAANRAAAEENARNSKLLQKERLMLEDRVERAKYEARYGPISDRAWRVMSAQTAFGGDEIHSAWLAGGANSWERKEEAKRGRELEGMRSSATEAFTKQAENAAAELEALGKTAKITGLLFSGMSAGATMYYQSKWAQDVARNITASNMAYYQRWESGGQIAGGLVGAIAGALIGGPIGAIIGATGLGGLAGLWGNYKQKELEGVLKTVATTTGARRDYLMFRGTSGFSMGQAMEDAGFGAASDLNNMRWTSQTLPGAMALGMVGEQDMLMLSLMPEYFSALMSGADAATLAAAYQKSVQNLPVQLRPLVATMAPGGSQGMYVNAIDPQFNNFLGYSHDMALRDRYFVAASERTMAGSIARSQKNLGLAALGVRENYAQGMQGLHEDYFDMSYDSPMSAWADAMTTYSAQGRMDPLAAEMHARDLRDRMDFEYSVQALNRMAEMGLNLTVRVEGLGDITQTFPMASLADGQSVSFNIGAQ